MSNLLIRKWRSFEFKVESGKRPLLFMSEIGIFEKKLKDCSKKVLQINNNKKF